MSDIIVVGAGCAGLTAALYAARGGQSVTVLECGGIGGQIASSPRVENYPGIANISGIAFSDALCAQAEAFGAELDLACVTGIEKTADGFIVHTDDGDRGASRVILATGAKPRTLGLVGEDTLSGISYCAVCDGAFHKGEDVAVVGGGSAAVQSAAFLSELCRSVTLIHRRDSFRGEDILARRLESLPNVHLRLNVHVTGLLGSDALTGLKLSDGDALTVTGLFIAAGRQPDNRAFSPLVALDEVGYIIAGEDCRTSCPGIFAAGDCRTKEVRQLTTAAADGAVAALAAMN
jgi:thioredoxin reductase (NADPH)